MFTSFTSITLVILQSLNKKKKKRKKWKRETEGNLEKVMTINNILKLYYLSYEIVLCELYGLH